MSLLEIAEQVRLGKTTALALAEEALKRVETEDPQFNSFLRVEAEYARELAAAVDQKVSAGEDPGPLAGVPIALKDNLCVDGQLTTAGSKMLANFKPPYDCTLWEKLRSAGAVLIGKTNLDEFAMGSSTENSAFGPTRNPWDTDRVPGGSSGGSAAAVAAGLVPVAFGSDTGGSIRQPAAFCGITGLKPTYGRVSRYGLIAFASSLDQIGPMARSAQDCALLLEVVAGHDPRDSTSALEEVPRFDQLEELPKGLKVGVPTQVMSGLSDEMRQSFETALDELTAEGIERVEVEMEYLDYGLSAYYVIAPAEASSNLARYDGVRYGHRSVVDSKVHDMMASTRAEAFGSEVQRRIMLGTYALSSGYYDAYYLKAQKARTILKNDFENCLQKCDLVAMPTTPTTAFRLGEKRQDPLEMYLSDVFTVLANLAGLPSLVVPGPHVGGLPTGLQLMGPSWSEGLLLQVGHRYQKQTRHHELKPCRHAR